MADLDLAVVGGGIAGSTVGRIMAEHGFRVAILEQVEVFKDRVRGEVTTAWGTAEAKRVGVYDLLKETCGHELPLLDVQIDGQSVMRRDLPATTPSGTPFFAFYHPAMQETLLQAAGAAGAEVHRGVHVTGVTSGGAPAASVHSRRGSETMHARLVVAADGRPSRCRKWGNFNVEQDPDRLVVSGVLFDSMDVAQDTAAFRMNTECGQMTFWFPQQSGNVRSYVVYQADSGYRLAGKKGVPRFIEESINSGADPACYEGSSAIGPLATFNGADSWVPHPYNEGVALVGDAAAASDASWGEGLSLALLDARTLTEQLLRFDDWEVAGHAYAEIHDAKYGAVHQIEDWLTTMFMDPSPTAAAYRQQAIPLIAQDLSRMPDLFGLGPETPTDANARSRFFGED